MATLSHKDIAMAIYQSSEGKKGEELSLFFKDVVKFLSKKKLLPKSGLILNKLENIANSEEGIIVAKVSSVKKLEEGSKKELISELIKRYKAKKVILIEKEDSKVLGGFKIEVGDEVIDLTIFNKLKKLQENLTR